MRSHIARERRAFHMGWIVAPAVLAAVALWAGRAQAAAYTWNKTAAGTYSWNDQLNWGGGASGFPNASGDVTNLNLDLAGVQTINLNQTVTTGTLNLGDTGGTYFGTTIATGTLNLQMASGTAAISKATAANTATDTISADITLGSDLTVTNAATSGALTFSGNVTGTTRLLTKAGAGTLNLTGTTSVGSLVAGANGSTTNGSLVVGTGGALTVGTGSSSYLYVGVTTANTANTTATLDASAAKSFTANVGNLYVGVDLSPGAATSNGTLKLGVNNSITASGQIVIGGNQPDSDAAASHVGTITTAASGTTTILTPSMVVGTSKGLGSFTSGAGSLVILGSTSARMSVVVGRHDTGTGNDRPANGNVDVSAGVANLYLNSLVLGRKTVGGAATTTGGTMTLSGSAANVIDINGQSINATSAALGVVQVGYSNVNGYGARGLLTISNAGTNSLITATDSGPAIYVANGPWANGTVVLGGGTTTITTQSWAIGGGSGTSALTLQGGVALKAGASSSDWIGGLTTGTLTTTGAVIDTNGYTLGISQAFSGTGSLTKAGAGSLTLVGVNAYTGTTTVSEGTLQVGSSGTVGALATTSVLTGSAGATLAFNRSDTITSGTHFNSVIGGSIGVAQLGSGTLVLNGANTYTGTTSVNNGTLQIGVGASSGTISSSSVLALGGGVLAVNRSDAFTQTFASTGLTPGASSVSGNATNAVSFGAITRGVGATLDIGTTGTFTTTTANTNGILGGGITFGGTTWAVANGASPIAGLASASYTTTGAAGTTAASYADLNIDVTSSAGTLSDVITPNSLRFNSAAATTVTLAAGGMSTVRNGILITANVGNNASVITGGTLAGPAGGDLVVVQNNTSSSGTIASVIADNTSATGLTKSGAGTLVLTGVNTYTGTTWVNNGSLVAGNANAFGLAGSPIVVNGGVLDLGGLALTQTGTVSLRRGTIQSGTLTNNTVAFDVQAGTASSVLAGSVGLVKTTVGTVTLSGSNTYTGTTSILQGELRLGNNGQTGSLNPSSTITGLGGATLAFNRSDSLVQGTAFASVLSGPIGVRQVGTGTTILTGSNTYLGPTTIDAGTLQIGNNGTAGSLGLTSAISGAAGGTLAFNRSDTITSGVHFNQVIRGPINVTQLGSGTVILAANNSYTGTTSIVRGTLQIGNNSVPGTLSPSSAITGSAGATLAFNRGFGIVSTQGTDFGSISGAINLANNSPNSNATVVLNQANTFSGTTTANVGPFQLSHALAIQNSVINTDGGGAFSLGTGITAPTIGGLIGSKNLAAFMTNSATMTALTLNVVSGTTVYSGTLNPAATTMRFSKSGAGTQVLTGSNTYTGTTSINAGTLRIGNASTTGALHTSSAITGSAGAALEFNRTNTVTQGTDFNSVIGGSINVTQMGSGTLVLNGVNTHTGTTSITGAGMLQLTSSGTLSSTGVVNVAATGARFDISGMTASVLTIGSLTSVASSTVALGAKTLMFGDATSGTIAGVFTGAGGGIVKQGTGTLTLSSNASSYTGGSQINGGTVILGANTTAGGNGVLGTGTSTNVVTINSGTLTGSGSGNHNWLDSTTLASGGANAHSVVINSGGMLQGANGTITGLGNVTLNGGTIEVSNGFVQNQWNGSYTLGGDVTVSGSLASSITTASGAGGSANLQMSNGSNGVGGTRTFTVNDVTGNSASDLVVSARLANGTIIKAGAGTLELAAGASGNGTPVNWQVNAGRLLVADGTMLGTSGTVNVAASGATFDISGITPSGLTIGALSGAAGSVVTLGSKSLAFGDATSTTFSGGIGGTGGIVKQGAGTVTLSGTSTYTGATTISSGTVILSVANAISGSSAITIGSSGSRGFLKIDDSLSISSLTFTGSGGDVVDPSNGLATFFSSSGTATITVSSGSNKFHANATLSSPTLVDVANGAYFSFHNNLAGGSALTKSGSGTLNLTGDNDTLSGNFFVTGGLVTIGPGMNQIGTGTTTLSGGATIDLNGRSFSDQIVVLDGTILNAGGTATTTTIAGISTVGGTTAQGTYNITSTGSALFNVGIGDGASAVDVNVNEGGGSGGRATFAQTVGANGNVTVWGGGTATFDGTVAGYVTTHGASTFNGNVLSGEVQVNSGTAGTGSALFAAGVASTVTIESGASAEFRGAVSGPTTVSGSALFTSASSLTGDLDVYAGGVANFDNLGSEITGSIHADGLVTVSRVSGSQTISGVIDGAGSLTKLGAGTLTLSGSNSYSGGTIVSGGTIQAGSANALGTGAVALHAGGLDLNGRSLAIAALSGSAGTTVFSGVAGAASLVTQVAGNSTFAGVIADGSGTVGLRKEGAGILTLSAAQSFTGDTIVAGGTLALGSGASLASAYIKAGFAAGDGGTLDATLLGSGLQLASGQKLGGHGTVLGNVVVANGAIVAPGGSIGSLTESGSMTWGGGGHYLFEIQNANGSTPGTNWDLLTVSSLGITASGTNPYVIDLQTLTNVGDQAAGSMPEGNWDPTGSYRWKFLVAQNTTFTATNFDAAWFNVNQSNFLNTVDQSGQFYVARGGGDGGLGGTTEANELYIVYAAVPEPGSLALAAVGSLTALGLMARRRRRGRQG